MLAAVSFSHDLAAEPGILISITTASVSHQGSQSSPTIVAISGERERYALNALERGTGVGILAPDARPWQKMYALYSELQLRLWFSVVDKDYNDVSGTQRVKWVSVGWLGCEVTPNILEKKGSRFQTPHLPLNSCSMSSLGARSCLQAVTVHPVISQKINLSKIINTCKLNKVVR